ncbi:MAG: lysophospholipid acyltransferase family protein [Candidatus Limnocylindria bacterium]
MLLRLGLELADRVVTALPARVVYRVADLAGDAWRRLAAGRRRLVEANLARVCEATGRPTSGAAFNALIRAAYRNHARYYAEVLRAPHYDPTRIAEIVAVPEWDAFRAVLEAGPSMLVSSHLGNFEPFGIYIAANGLPAMAPIEEIEPRPLFEFLAARRGGSAVEIVPLRTSRSALSRRLRDGGVVGVLGDRAVGGRGQPVTVFGHTANLPNGPATLAVTHRATVIVGCCLRTGPDRFEAQGDIIGPLDSGDRRADIAALTERFAARFERDIAAAPEQWWGAFQPFWPDLGT